MKKLLFTLIFTLLSLYSSYTQNPIKKGKLNTIKQLQKRSLAVVLLKEDKSYIDKLTKKIAKVKNKNKSAKLKKELVDYKKEVLLFNKAIKEVVASYWTLNEIDDVTYLTKQEANKLYKTRSNKYAVLDLTYDAVLLDFDTSFYMDIHKITYGASENKRDAAVYKNFITNVNYNLPVYADKKQKKQTEILIAEKEKTSKILSKENLTITIALTQKYIKQVIALNKVISFEDFGIEQANKNCSSLANTTILIQKASVHGEIQDKLKKLYPQANIQLVSAKRIEDAINNNEDVSIGFLTTKKFVKSKGSLGSLTSISVIPVSH